MKHKLLFLFVTLFSLNNSIAQDTPLGNKIVGNGDAANYYIGHFAVPGSDGLDLHWHGGIRFGDATSNSVMQITNGNVGIGTISPSARLQISNNIAGITSFKAVGVNGNVIIDNVGSGENYYNANKFHQFQIAGIPKMHISTNGNIGIGTTEPSVTTHIEKSASGIVDILRIKNNYGGTSGLHGTSILLDGYYSQSKITSYENPQSTLGGNLQLQTYNNQGVLNAGILLDRSGNVGIGSVNPDSKLTVNGTIHSTEVKVTQTVPADYVFQKYYTGKSELKSDYTMPTLAEVESFTKINNHLPNVPSAKEMQQNGVLLGEMSNVLLQKIEELTLYVIEQNKKIEALEAKLSNK
ncbi:hypothetical protein [Flavobacterium sp. CF136]|uniref:hypothetical protein n=1 Tax=Flavobacterium sp. (strain CF136) TaxID=1144313 RepID=UPI0002717C8E|nr:hypothetical protein [Flavobacterium sp. CF136]EJL63059.1 hypothetical protein PMI10_02685 [Flavobacterium sp. CF136]